MITPSVREFGYSPADVSGRAVTDFYAKPLEREALLAQLEAHGQVRDYRVRLRRGDGSVFWVAANSHYYLDTRGEVAGVEGTFRDITVLKQAEEQLRILAQAIEHSPVSIIITDSNAEIVHVNPAFERISGYSFEEVLGKNPRLLSAGHTPPETYREMWVALTAGKSWQGELMNRRKNGETYWELGSIAPVRDAGGKTTHYVSVQEDITAAKKVALNLQRSQKEALDARKAQSWFLSAASHDLRQPLQAQHWFIEALVEQIGPGEPQALLAKVLYCQKMLQVMLDGILEISKLDSGLIQPRLQAVAVPDLFKALQTNFEPIAKAKGLELFAHCPDQAGALTDAEMLRRILSNLISNAIHHTERGSVLLACRRCSQGWRLEVRDSGTGIHASEQENIFKEFYQLDKPVNGREEKGIGLGLSIVRRLSATLGHACVLRSASGRGSTFAIVVPASSEAPSPIRPRGAKGELPANRHILVIDDNCLVRDSLRMALTRLGHEIAVASDRIQAEAAVNEDRPDVIVCDYSLEKDNGIDVIARLRRIAGRMIPAVLISGDIDSCVSRQAKQSGIPLLTKPVDVEKLLAEITSILPSG